MDDAGTRRQDLAGGRILAVDDEPAWVELIDSVFRGLRAQVCGVTDPREAIVMARIYEFDVAILDWSLGAALTGFDLLRSLRRVRPGIACIIVTGHAAGVVPERLRAAGIPVLEKPFDLEALRAAVAAVLPGVQARPTRRGVARDSLGAEAAAAPAAAPRVASRSAR